MKRVCKALISTVLVLSGSLIFCMRHYVAQSETERFHNVIVLIPDGCGVAHMTIARWFKGAPLAQDSMDASLVHTFSANSMITGSAAAATAFATGFKTWEETRKARCLSTRPDSMLLPNPEELGYDAQWRPVATVLEGARLAGKAVGLVATSRVSHATPAAYASHWHSRDNNNVIIEQMVYGDVDVVFGGGFRYLIDVNTQVPGRASKGRRLDGEDLYQVLRSKGYTVIRNKEELETLEPDTRRVWGVFATDHMVHDIDRPELAPDEPSLAEMTEKAIEILSKDPEGFFLMIEGSQVDWSSHDNDPVGVVTDYIAFDQAVRAALDFAKSQLEQRTLVLVFPDHDNGGMSLGHGDMNSYAFEPRDMNNVLSNASLTAAGVEWLIWSSTSNTGPNADSIERIVAQYYGIADLTDKETQAILTELADTLWVNLRAVIGPMLSERAGIGWTTFDHTGNDVPMFSHGFARAPQTIDNTEIAHLCAHAMGFDLSDVNQRLIVEADELFENASLVIDTIGVEMSRGHLTVEKSEKKAMFPFFKNIMVVDQDTFNLEGLTLYSLKAHKVFLPRQAAQLFNEH